MPKPVTKELSDAENFLERAMSLQHMITRLGDTSNSAPIMLVLQQVREDLTMYSQIASGRALPSADGGATPVAAGTQPTQPTKEERDQMQDAAWMQSGATQANVFIRQFLNGLSTSPITTDAQAVYADILGDSTGLHADKLISDLETFLRDIEVVAGPASKLAGYREPDGGAARPRSAAGALARYLGPVLDDIKDARSSLSSSLSPGAITQLKAELTTFSQSHDLLGKDGNSGMCLDAPRL
jgi:hypothetical protein